MALYCRTPLIRPLSNLLYSRFSDPLSRKESMEIASFVIEIVKDLWALASKPLGYIYNLKDNVRSLDEANEILKAVSEHVQARVEGEEEEARAQRTKQVAIWLGKVQEFAGGVDRVLREAEERDRIKCLSRCLPPNCWSSYKLGKRVNQMLDEARELQHKEGEFVVVTSPLPPPPVLEIPMDKTVGLDSSLSKVWKWLVDEKRVGMIGLCGTGGVGKTTLMKRINEELLHANHGFEIVIWAVVSRQVNEDGIRDAIRKRLHIQDERWDRWSQDQRVDHLHHVLTRKKFVLLIDDVWARLDLSKIGVPRPGLENGSKVVFTTRSKQVCHQMEANETCEVQCLTPEEALELFENHVGKSTVHSHPEILEFVKDIVRECKGLPLALITVGRAMAGRENPQEWKHALRTLKNNPYKLSGMVDEVYHILEFSYNSLNDSTVQLCFLYCCLFPEDYNIRSDNLIELWIGEGLLGDTDDVYSLRDKGVYVLGSLKLACLLESGGNDYEEHYVKMHDVIRDMATWIAHDHGQRENKLLVIEKDQDMSGEMISKWGEVEKVSLWGEWIRNIDRTSPRCAQLKTLLVRNTKVRLVPRGFFDSMTARLMVLDLSDNKHIESFPEGICNLINLRYLNLSRTSISELPREIKNLTRLRWLLLDYMSGDILIPTGAITNLPLNVFSMWGSDLRKEEEMVEELERMQNLNDLSIHVCKSSSVLKIFQSPYLQYCIRRVYINNCNDLIRIPISHSLTGSGNFPHLETLDLSNCWGLREMEITQGIVRAPNCSYFPSLVDVQVQHCGFSNLSWLVHAPKLRTLTVFYCHSMEKIIGDGITGEELSASRLFSCLESLTLVDVPKLTSICDHTLSFPPGVKFTMIGCPGLRRKLWLDLNSARGSFSVKGDKEWWAEFEWDPAARVTLKVTRMRAMNEITIGEMAFGEAVRKIKDDKSIVEARMEFRP